MFTPFYNESIRKLIVAFGSLFNNIRISTTNSQGETDHIKVPLSYGPKEKFLRRIEESSGISDHTKVQITLPRLGFNITDMTYDSTRKRNTIQRRYYHPKGYTYDGGHRAFEYSEVPYNFNISMYGFTRTMTDALQITEQVLPYFTPDFIVTVKFDENAHSKVDIPFVLNNVTIEEEYEGDFQDRRNITTQYDFSAKSYIYGPRKNSKVILFTENTFYSYFGTTTDLENVSVQGLTGALGRVDVGVSGASTDGGTGYSAGNYITFDNRYSLGPSGSGPILGPRYIDTFGNTFAGASYNPPNF